MSAVYARLPGFDWASTTTITVPDAARFTGERWAKEIFDIRSVPLWTKALFGVREVAAKVLRIPPGEHEMLAVREVVDGEAVLDTDDVHLHFAAGIRTEGDLVHVITVVRFKGVRGQVYFVPVRFLHDQITRSMMHAAARRMLG